MYVVNCDKLTFFKAFSSMNDVITYLSKLNKSDFDGRHFSLFGRGSTLDESGIWVDDEYYIDSVVLCHKNNPNEYYKFFIRCIDSNGNRVELDN